MKKEYFRILLVQMNLKLGYDCEKEFLIDDEEYFRQMEFVMKKICKNDYDVIVFPEMSYHKEYDNYFSNNSKDKIIVYGSHYIGNENCTIVYHNNKKFCVSKAYSSGVEPSIRYQDNISVNHFMKSCLKDHTFVLKGKKFIVLNCAEYYKVAYFIARDEVKSKNLFGFLVPCANNNNEVFLTESKAIHNHCDNVYSFVVNSSAYYNEEKYSSGGSYVFGKMSVYERDCGCENRIKHPSNICYLDEGSYLIDGEFLFKDSSLFYRSDDFRHTPKNLKIERIEG